MDQSEKKLHHGVGQLKELLIPSTSFVDNHVVYHIKVCLSQYSWIVKRRYREFCELHENLSARFTVKQNLFPPKKYIGNLNPEHIEKRRLSLEVYLQHVLQHVEKIPRVLQIFLEFHYYDIFAVTQTLAENLFRIGDNLLIKEKPFVATPLQLYCISQRLKLPIPTCDGEGYRHDVGNLYDFVYCVKNVKIEGDENHDLIGLSSEEISFDLSLFKSLESLEVINCNIESLQGTYHLQEHVKKLSAHFSIHLLKDMLIDQEVWTPNLDIATFTSSIGSHTSLAEACCDMVWKKLTEVDFSRNYIPYIDESVTLLHKLGKLDLSFNEIKEIEHLQDLPHLTELDLSHNKIESLEGVNTKLGNIQVLKLAANKLQSVGGLPKVYSLVHLDLSINDIDGIANVFALANLPCLDVLNLLENPVRKKEMYRARLLAAFEDRVSQVCLDNAMATAEEIISVPVVPCRDNNVFFHATLLKDVMQLLTRMDTYEMIASPPQKSNTTPIRNKTGQKKASRRIKIKNQVVLESPAAEVVSVPRDDTKYTDGEQEFKNRVEQIRQLGGDAWLGILNELQNEYKEPAGPKTASLPNPTGTADQNGAASLAADTHVTVDLPDTGNQIQESSVESLVAQFGFSSDLETLVEENIKESEKLVTGTFITTVEVDKSGSNEEKTIVDEERMVGVDLSKGVLMEIEIDSGRTRAKHKLRDVNSVDILELSDSVFVDLRHTQSKTFQRHRDVDVTSYPQDYKHIAKYKMRSLKDAAELFVLLFKFINDSSNIRLPGRQQSNDSLPLPSPDPEKETTSSSESSNPVGISTDLLHQHFSTTFLKQQSLETELTESSCDTVHHDNEVTHLVLWTSCLPYALPEHDLPVCLVLTNANIYLFQLRNESNEHTARSTSLNDIETRLPMLCHLPLTQLRVVTSGLFELGFRLEFSKRGPRGTFTFLTRDSRQTESFLRTLREVTKLENSVPTSDLFEIVYPSEEKLETMKVEIAKSCGKTFGDDERILVYAFVREILDMTSAFTGHVTMTSNTRTLVVTNWRLLLCEEDHVHWPLPSYVKYTPSTPQWVVTQQDDVKRIIGIEIFDVVGHNMFTGTSGMSIILEQNAHAPDSHQETKTWHLIFKTKEEREQLQRSLSQIWSFNFNGSLQITKVTQLNAQKIHHSGRVDVPAEFFQQVDIPALSPPGTPVKNRKGHRRNASGHCVSKHQDDMVRKSLQVVQRSDVESMEKFFTENLRPATAGSDSETIVSYSWTGCVAYTHPTREIYVWLILSSLKVYIVADALDGNIIDAVQNFTFCPGAELCFNWFSLTSLRQVCVGFFDQTFRLETDDPESTFTFITRDYQATSNFLENLKTTLQESASADVALATEKTCSEVESPSIYDVDTNSSELNDEQSSELYLQHGVLRFLYPSDDSVELLRHTIVEFSKTSECCPEIPEVSILMYLLVFQIIEGKKLSRTFMILDQAVCLCLENYVNFPLPLFVKGLPMGSRYEVERMRPLAGIKRIEFSGFNSQDFTIVFEDKRVQAPISGDSVEHKSGDEFCRENACPFDEVRWTLIAQTYEEKEKAVAMILKFWKEICGNDLPVLKI